MLVGEIYLSPRMMERLLHGRNDGKAGLQDPIEKLSNRELEVLQMIGSGSGTQQIARQLLISSKTVDGYRENIKRKLDLKNSTELHRRAFQWAVENR